MSTINMRKVTKREYKKFDETFKLWQLRFGCPEYEIATRHGDTGGNVGSLSADSSGCTGVVGLCTHIAPNDDLDNWVEDVAKHEALHLLLLRLTDLAKGRFASEDEIDRENERITRILEKLI